MSTEEVCVGGGGDHFLIRITGLDPACVNVERKVTGEMSVSHKGSNATFHEDKLQHVFSMILNELLLPLANLMFVSPMWQKAPI
jgi:hypothetical protein